MKRHSCLMMMAGGGSLAGDGPLDGQSYAIQYRKRGGWFTRNDRLMFRCGKLYSTACDFGEGPYSAVDVAGFHAKNSTDRVDWLGTIRGGEIVGSFVRRRPGKPPVEYAFQGKRAK
jgi:hypothetical protein